MCQSVKVSTDHPTASLTPYNKGMNNKPLKPVHNGMFLVNDTAAKDDLCQQVMASYIATLRAEAARRERIRQGLEPAGQWGEWHISDRH